MKKVLLAVGLVFILGGIAQADYWVRTGVFEPGYYIMCDIQFDLPTECFLLLAGGSEEEAQSNVDIMNSAKDIAKSIDVRWFRWTGKDWLKYEPPWKYIAGEPA